MDVSLLSRRYFVRVMREFDVSRIYELCRENTLYYQYCPPFVSEKSILDDMSSLPPNKEMKDKFYLGYFDGEKLIAVLDLIMGFPDEATSFIGFFMTDVDIQNTGVGSEMIEELCMHLTQKGISKVRLGWIKGNTQAEHFWHKNRFSEIGTVYDKDEYTVVVAQRHL